MLKINENKINIFPNYQQFPSRFFNAKIGAVSLVALAVLVAYAYFPRTSTPIVLSSIPRIDPSTLDEREADLQELLGPESLRLDPNDTRPKLLYLTAQDDPSNSALSVINRSIDEFCEKSFKSRLKDTPYLTKLHEESKINSKAAEELQNIKNDYYQMMHEKYRGSEKIIRGLDKSHDIRYKVIRKPEEICEEIKAATKAGELKSVIIQGHGREHFTSLVKSFYGLHVSEEGTLIGKSGKLYTLDSTQKKMDESCFSGLSPDATITLISCKQGKQLDGLAQAIAIQSKRVVWAPKENAHIFRTSFSETVPPVPTFTTAGSSLDGDKVTCKFYPNGEHSCDAFQTKFIDKIKSYFYL